MSAPDPKGCERCGRVECRRLRAIERYRTGMTTRGDADRALVECDEHLVDWRSLYFATSRAGSVTVEGTVEYAVNVILGSHGHILVRCDHQFSQDDKEALLGKRVTVALLGKDEHGDG